MFYIPKNYKPSPTRNKILKWLALFFGSFVILHFICKWTGLDFTVIGGYLLVTWAILSIFFDVKKIIGWIKKQKEKE